jgi:diguanylate cyclase (GGDEF)-like protein/PAS domain S-box-containing protein
LSLPIVDCLTCRDESRAEKQREIAKVMTERDGALNALFELGTAGIAEVDFPTGRFLRVSPRFCEIMRRDAYALLDLRTNDVVHPEDVEAAEREWMQAMRANGRWETTMRHLAPDGEVFWTRIGVSAWKWDDSGAPLRCVAVLQDVTDKVRPSLELRRKSEMIRLCQQIGRIGFFTRDVETGLANCCAETCRMFGLPPDEIPLPWTTYLAHVAPEDAAMTKRLSAEAMRRGVPEMSYAMRVTDPVSGELRFLELRLRYVYDEHGRAKESIGVVIDVTSAKAAEQRLAHAARHDALTGLANRLLFRERIEEEVARGAGFALLCFDLDRFKDINDAFGHPAGDRALIEASRRMLAECADLDLVARLGGDEFAIVQHAAGDPQAAESLALRLIARLSEPFPISGHTISVGVGVGVALAPRHGNDYETLLKAADLALYRAKGEGRGRVRLFDPALKLRAQKKHALESDLKRAIEAGEFEVFYQPVVDVASLKIQGFEALARWRHPERGLLGPNEFIPICEEIGLIAPLGAWVLKQACQDAARWPEGMTVAVNLSPMQFLNAALEADVKAALEASGLPARQLELEITESVLLSDSATTMATLHRLKSLGAHIAMDDFGSGYSSLSYLQRFPFDKVKIDRAFTEALGASPKTRAIVRAIINLCAELQMVTIAEGVETVEQFDALKRKGCNEVQGYLFGAPTAAADALLLIERERGRRQAA